MVKCCEEVWRGIWKYPFATLNEVKNLASPEIFATASCGVRLGVSIVVRADSITCDLQKVVVSRQLYG